MLYAKQIFLKKGRERSVENKHPWIFSGAIERKDQSLSNGEIAVVFSHEKKLLCTGFYHSGSIAVRIIDFGNRLPDKVFFEEKLSNALQTRASAGLTFTAPTNAWRLIHGEGDSLPGLIIDNYDGHLVMQMHHIGWETFTNEISAAIKQFFDTQLKSLYVKYLDYQKLKHEKNGQFILGNENTNIILENGNQFKVNREEGQKTGFFLDQRANRELLKSFANGRNVLNLFCYTGGFSIYALQGKAKSVTGVDISADAITLARENVLLNGFDSNYKGMKANVNDYMKTLSEEFNLIIVDPPAFAKSRNHLKNAMNAYRRLNKIAIEKIQQGGIIFTFSCSQAVDEITFGKIIFEAASLSGRNVKILHRMHQPPDHPVNIFHPEGAYLKGFVLEVQ